MEDTLMKEIVRLVKEISVDESNLKRAEELRMTRDIPIYKDAIERKMRLLEVLKKA